MKVKDSHPNGYRVIHMVLVGLAASIFMSNAKAMDHLSAAYNIGAILMVRRDATDCEKFNQGASIQYLKWVNSPQIRPIYDKSIMAIEKSLISAGVKDEREVNVAIQKYLDRTQTKVNSRPRKPSEVVCNNFDAYLGNIELKN